MIKRSECRCICHTDAVALGLIAGPMHVIPCCEEDDNMAFKSMQSKDGGYCPRCDTVWALPGKCKCEENNKMFKGQLGKFNTELTEYSKEVIEKYDDNNLITVEMVGIKNEREELLIKLWWNAAIEAALDKIDDSELYCAVARLKK